MAGTIAGDVSECLLPKTTESFGQNPEKLFQMTAA
jgi:hypothetical protein